MSDAPAASTPSISGVLSKFVAEITFNTIPEAVRATAMMHLLDTFGVALAAASIGETAPTATALATLASGNSKVIGSAHRLTVRDAAMVNGMLIHSLEFDDCSVLGRIHPSASCAAVALSLAASQHLSGRELLTAYVAGLETSIRIGAAARGGFTRVGFDAIGIVAAFGSALVAGRLFGLSSAQLATATSVAYSFTSGNREFMAELAWTKRLHPGWHAASGITAAAMAKAGFLAPLRPFEGKFGLYNLYLPPRISAEPALDQATFELARTWHLAGDLAYKPLPVCFFNIPAVDAAIALAVEHDIKPQDIAEIVALVPEQAIATICEPAAIRLRPTHRFAAQFSVYFTVAAALVRRRLTLDDLDDASLHDPAILALADKVTFRIDERTTFPKFYSAALIITLKDGRTFERREDIHRGSPSRPMSNDEVLAKFADNAARVHAVARVERIRQLVLDLPNIEDVAVLESALATDS